MIIPRYSWSTVFVWVYSIIFMITIGCLVYAISSRLDIAYIINVSDSSDGVLWRVQEVTPTKGNYVVLCLPSGFIAQHGLAEHVESAPFRRSCGGLLPLIKQLVAVPGDYVDIDQLGIRVNGSLLPDSGRLIEPASIDELHYILPEHEYLVAGETADSLDSRYFGAIDKIWITGTAQQIF